MELYTKEQYEQLVKNGDAYKAGNHNFPVVKWFTPDANCTWLISEIIEDDIAYGLCDLGLGFPELGNVFIPEILSVRGKFGLHVERDLSFQAKYPIRVYADAAWFKGCITENDEDLRRAAKKR